MTARGPAPTPPDKPGAVRASLRGLKPDRDATPEELALYELALSHAAALDAGAGMAQAAVGRELRATLEQMRLLREARNVDLDAADDFLNRVTPIHNGPRPA